MSDFDLRLFQELQKDGRIPYVTLAGRMGVSEAHVRRRVTRLTESEVFSITAVADPKVLGVDCMAWLGLNAHDAQASRVAQTLVEQPEIDYVVQTAGSFNVMAEAVCRSSADLYQLLCRIRGMPGVQRTETFVYLNLLRQRFQWSLDGNSRSVRDSSGFRLDALDVDLISELEHDGRASFSDIARRLGVSQRTVSSRVARLIDENALQVIAVGNPATLGFHAMAWLGLRVHGGVGLEEAALELSNISGIDYVVIPCGRYDLMAELVCHDQAELLDVLEQGIGRLPAIAQVESFVYLKLLYSSTIGAWGASRSLGAAHEVTKK